MNERIKELAEQADIKFDVYSDNYGVDTATVVPYDLEKFAELIIKECGRVADVFCHIWCEEDKPHEVTVSNYIKRHVLRADPE
jgi:hypothetical protein